MVGFSGGEERELRDMEVVNCDILFVGNLSLDTIECSSGELRQATGGSAYNCSYCASISSSLRIKVGSVAGHDFPLHAMRDRGIDVDSVAVLNRPSNSFVINDDMATVFCQEHNMLRFCPQYAESTQHLHISCRKGIDNPMACLQTMMYETSSLDVMYSSLRDRMEDVVECLKVVDMLFLNEAEYTILGECLGGNPNHVFPNLWISSTQGQSGVVLRRHTARIHLAGIDIGNRLVSAVGAGDAFVGGFLGAYVSGRGLSECLALGVSIATVSIQDFGVSHITDRLSDLGHYYIALLSRYRKADLDCVRC